MTKKTIFWADGQSPKMIEAITTAQKTFKYFWREVSWDNRRIVPALNVACVKIVFMQEIADSEELLVEHMWINDVQFDGTNVMGVLVNEPNGLTNVACGDFVTVPLEQVSDWLFAMTESKPKKKLFGLMLSNETEEVLRTYGGFTIHAMRSEMNNAEREQHDSAWGMDFGDYNDILYVHEQKTKPENLVEHPMSKNMRPKLVEYFETNPAEVLASDDNGHTILHSEAIAGNLTSVEVLLAMGADKNAKTNQGETALDLAQKLEWSHLISLLQH